MPAPAALRRRRRRDSSAGQRRRRRLCRHFQIAQDGSGRKQPGPASPTPAVPGCWAGGLLGRGEIRHAPADTCLRRAVRPGGAVSNAACRRRRRAWPSGLRGRPRRSPHVPEESRGGASTSRQRGARLAVFAGRVGGAGTPGSRPSPEILIAPERSGWKQPHTATPPPAPCGPLRMPGPHGRGSRGRRRGRGASHIPPGRRLGRSGLVAPGPAPQPPSAPAVGPFILSGRRAGGARGDHSASS